MVDVRMLRTSPATRSFWTAADAGSAGISWPHATEYQALHNFISKNIETKKGQGNWQIQGNMIQYLIQHDSTWSNTANQSQHNTVAGEKEQVAWVQTQDLLQVSGQRIAGFDLFPGCNAWVPTALRRRWLKVWMFMMFVDLLLSDSQLWAQSPTIYVFLTTSETIGIYHIGKCEKAL